jgi:hypothetical protein
MPKEIKGNARRKPPEPSANRPELHKWIEEASRTPGWI